MPVDPSVMSAIDTSAARGAAAAGVFAEQHGAMIVAAAQHDSRLMNGFLAAQLFNQAVMESKSAYHTPVDPSSPPLPSPPAK